MNMEIDKDKFRGLLKEDKVGAALNQLSDIGNFLNDENLQYEIARLSTKYQAVNPATEEGEAQVDEIKKELLHFIDQLPEDFEPAAAGADGKGCLGAILAFAAFLLACQPIA